MDTAPGRVERVAHRGASRERLENTIEAFHVALERGADAIELDVHATRDGVVVVHHDPVAAGRVIRDTSWADLSELVLAGGAHVPRLEDVLQLVGDRATVYVELKGDGCEAAALDTVRANGGNHAVHSFDHAMIERARQLAPDVARGVLLDRGLPHPTKRMREAVERTAARDIWPHRSLVDREFMAAAHALGVRALAWTVNSRDDAERLIDLGVAGICTDDIRMLAGL